MYTLILGSISSAGERGEISCTLGLFVWDQYSFSALVKIHIKVRVENYATEKKTKSVTTLHSLPKENQI